MRVAIDVAGIERRHVDRGRDAGGHPDIGLLRFDYEALLVGDVPEQRLVTWLPADEATTAALEPAAPSRLRVVGR